MSVTIDPSDYLPLFGGDLGNVFLLVTSPDIRKELVVDNRKNYDLIEYIWTDVDSRTGFIHYLDYFQQKQQYVSTLWITTCEFEHFHPEQLHGIKIAALPFFSAGFSLDALKTSLEIVKGTNYERELEKENLFLSYLDQSNQICFLAPEYGTKAIFKHYEVDHWFSINGPLSYGQQCVLPTGEISALTNSSGDFSYEARFALDGEIILSGMPVVHRGSPVVRRTDTERTFEKLAVMQHYPVIAIVRQGLIEKIQSPFSGQNPFLNALNELFAQDERYRKIHEIGFGMNERCAPLRAGNFFPNERFPGVHFGIGLGGHTSFHHDFICVDLQVIFELSDAKPIDIYRKMEI